MQLGAAAREASAQRGCEGPEKPEQCVRRHPHRAGAMLSFLFRRQDAKLNPADVDGDAHVVFALRFEPQSAKAIVMRSACLRSRSDGDASRGRGGRRTSHARGEALSRYRHRL